MRPASAIALLLAALAGGSSGAAETSRPREVAISNPAMIADADARQRLRYLASCALDADTVLTAGNEGTRYRFPGGMALAPEWAAGAISPEQRRLVSACILARTNLFGVPVQISMRAEGGPPSLIATDEERRSHPAHEGGFFGDIFAKNPTAYVCVEDGHAARRAAEESEQRVCTHPSGKFTADGRPLSRCGFVIVEGCGDGADVEIDGRLWTEIIHVYLPRH